MSIHLSFLRICYFIDWISIISEGRKDPEIDMIVIGKAKKIEIKIWVCGSKSKKKEKKWIIVYEKEKKQLIFFPHGIYYIKVGLRAGV